MSRFGMILIFPFLILTASAIAQQATTTKDGTNKGSESKSEVKSTQAGRSGPTRPKA